MKVEDPIATAIGAIVDAGALAGAATLVWRDGKVVQTACVGWRDVEARLPIERDTLFRIASMTKPITSTAALMLFEEGRFALDDPIARWAPEFSKMRVLRSPTGPLDETEPAERPITFEDLLTHRSGLTYGDFHPGPIAKAYEEALGGDIDSEVAPDDWIAALAALPLDRPAGGRIPLWPLDRSARAAHRAHRRCSARRRARAPDFRPAGDEGHRLHRPPREARPAGRAVRLRRGGPPDSAASPLRAARRCPSGPRTWPMSPAARVFGRRWTTISPSRGCS